MGKIRRVKIDSGGSGTGSGSMHSKGRSERTRICAGCDEPVIYAEKGKDGLWRCNSCVKRKEVMDRESVRQHSTDSRDLDAAFKNPSGDLKW